MDFNDMLEEQRVLQEVQLYPMGCGTGAVKENTLALMVEAGEMLNMLPWKMWKKSHTEPEHSEVLAEVVDMQRFLCNIINELSTPAQFTTAWHAKARVINNRINNGY